MIYLLDREAGLIIFALSAGVCFSTQFVRIDLFAIVRGDSPSSSKRRLYRAFLT